MQSKTTQQQYEDAVTKGIAEGKAKAESLYGKETLSNLGGDISGVIAKRKSDLYSQDPSIGLLERQAGKQAQASKAEMAKSGIKGAYASKVLGEQNLSNQSQIAAQKYKTEQANLSEYQKLLGNIAASSTQTELGYGALKGAGIKTETPTYESGGMSVICTELKRQNKLPKDVWSADYNYGVSLLKTSPRSFYGYYVWAKHVAGWMAKSSALTSFVSMFAIPWANHIAGKHNVFGAIINNIGLPVCYIIGGICDKCERFKTKRICK